MDNWRRRRRRLSSSMRLTSVWEFVCVGETENELEVSDLSSAECFTFDCVVVFLFQFQIPQGVRMDIRGFDDILLLQQIGRNGVDDRICFRQIICIVDVFSI